MKSENYIVEAPLSYTGSVKRLWHLNWILALFLIPLAWCVVTAWYMIFGLLIVPYRLMRRAQRKRRLAELRHEELLEEIKKAGRK